MKASLFISLISFRLRFGQNLPIFSFPNKVSITDLLSGIQKVPSYKYENQWSDHYQNETAYSCKNKITVRLDISRSLIAGYWICCIVFGYNFFNFFKIQFFVSLWWLFLGSKYFQRLTSKTVCLEIRIFEIMKRILGNFSNCSAYVTMCCSSAHPSLRKTPQYNPIFIPMPSSMKYAC